jgi:hypothetical protein
MKSIAMRYQSIDELLTELLVIKDIYICGRMNKAICESVEARGEEPKSSRDNWTRYQKLSKEYISNSVNELFEKQAVFREEIAEHGEESLFVVLDSSYVDFDEGLLNEMMIDFYGDKNCVGFASAYNYFAEDFNALINEHLSPRLTKENDF